MIFLVRFLLFFGARSCVELYDSLRVHSLSLRAFWLGTLDSSNTSLLAEMLVDSNVKTNRGRKFLNIVDRRFPKNHLLHKTFNRHTLKRSYSCVSNMKSTISSYNEHVLSNLNSPTQQSDTCNCRKKNRLSARRKMHPKDVINQVTATTETTSETYTPYSKMAANKLFFCLHVNGPFAAGVR